MQVERMIGKAHSRLLSPSLSPATSPTLSAVSSPTPQTPTPTPVSQTIVPNASYTPKLAGIPSVAAASRYTAPVHIDVGGTIYTSSLETLTTRFGESRLAKMFNGGIPIVLDSLKQHYFIDRDGQMFRHVLNFVRNGRLLLPDDFADVELLLEEAKYYDIIPMVKALEVLRMERRMRNGQYGDKHQNSQHNGHPANSSPISGHRCSPVSGGMASGARLRSAVSSSNRMDHQKNSPGGGNNSNDTIGAGGAGLTCRKDLIADDSASPGEDCNNRLGWECLALYVSPDLGERIMLSGDRNLVEECFPEIATPLMDARSSVAWNQDPRHVIRFPLNGYCKLNSMQAITRLLNASFSIAASNGGGVEGQQFSEYLFIRKAIPL
ncbi:BTB/POZ domain-containing protein kctd15-like [Daphnia carinata]|uniref:BTB/POZ domain-containing protein kctd15-like n=1 Tax=Daphnia carinata TaxID=120202 RepID=UPI00257C9755|nr:BTB/POZ domain-containing protein kctd15-like [Daphnia carinata]